MFDKKAYDREWKKKNKEKLNSTQRVWYRDWYSKNKDKVRGYQQASALRNGPRVHQKKTPEKVLKSRVSKYGMSVEEYEALLIKQENGCAICSVDLLSVPSHIDHCHKSGKVRGILCRHCNRGLGGFRDESSLLVKASEYLKTSETSME